MSNRTSMDDIVIFSIFVILGVAMAAILGLAVLSSANYNPPPPLPLSCGLTEENSSEEYHVSSMCGKVPCTQTYYYHDLVCTNGTTIFQWEK